MSVSVAVEGASDESVARAVLVACGLGAASVYGGKGKSYLLEKLDGYNRAAQFRPWLVLVDLDSDHGGCVARAHRSWLPAPAELMCFRVAVRAIEAWLLADVESVSSFLGVSSARIPTHPEDLVDPKRTLIDLARASRRRSIRGLVPRQGSAARVGPTYVSDVSMFALEMWRPDVASENAPSLARCLSRIEELAAKLGG